MFINVRFANRYHFLFLAKIIIMKYYYFYCVAFLFLLGNYELYC